MAINAEIIRIRGTVTTILPNVNTLQCILWLEQSVKLILMCRIPSHEIYMVLIVMRVKIMSVNSILVHCNIIYSSYMCGTQAPVAYNFYPNAAPGQKILEAPHNLIYLPVTVNVISTLSVWVTDQHGNLLD